jgi:hypothetical protein
MVGDADQVGERGDLSSRALLRRMAARMQLRHNAGS